MKPAQNLVTTKGKSSGWARLSLSKILGDADETISKFSRSNSLKEKLFKLRMPIFSLHHFTKYLGY